MKLPISLPDPLDPLEPLLLDGLPFDPSLQFTSMGFERRLSRKCVRRESHEGRSNRKRDTARGR